MFQPIKQISRSTLTVTVVLLSCYGAAHAGETYDEKMLKVSALASEDAVSNDMNLKGTQLKGEKESSALDYVWSILEAE